MAAKGKASQASRTTVWWLLVSAIGVGLAVLIAVRLIRQPAAPAQPSLVTVAPTAIVTDVPAHTVSAAAPVVALPVQTALRSSARLAVDGIVSNEIVTTTRVSIATGGQEGNGPALSVALSADGRYVAFASKAANLVAGSDNGYDDVFLHDRETHQTSLVSVAPDGSRGDSWSDAPAISADGRFVAFYSWAGNLVPGDTNAVQDVFVYDLQTGQVTRMSVATGDGQANDRSGSSGPGARPAISADGRFVAFESMATNLVTGDTNDQSDIFVRDRKTGSTTRVSLATGGVQANGDSVQPALSADGRFVAFQSTATNLDPAATSGFDQIYVHDRESGQTLLLSRAADDTPGDGDSADPVLSSDGRFVAFQSAATNLVAQDTNRAADVFLADRTTGQVTRVSVASTGAQGNRVSSAPAISPDGRYIGFVSAANNLVNGDTNNATDVFLCDRLSRHTTRVSLGVIAPRTGRQADRDSSGPPAISTGGRLVAFVSAATNLVTGDTNQVDDVFVHARVDSPAYTLSGRVVDAHNDPVAQVTVTAGPHQVTTDAGGQFVIPYVAAGTYTLVATKTGYSFSPSRRIVSMLFDLPEQNFVAFPDTATAAAFLTLPFAYGSSTPAFLQALRDTDDGGLVDSWFDHQYPDYSKNGAILLWDGRARTVGLYNPVLGCYERRCYDGHDGIDFPYRDPNPATPDIYEPIAIHPAAAGTVVATFTGCTNGDRRCHDGYGNQVIIDHGNGYLTRYAHLAEVDVRLSPSTPVRVSPADVIGIMGSTGNSLGTHLHFGVYRDNGNGLWDGDQVDKPVDPFGWAGTTPDPWVAVRNGPVSRWLWVVSPNADAYLFGSQGVTLQDVAGTIQVDLPPGAFDGQARVELAPDILPALPEAPRRSLGRAFRLGVLERMQASDPAQASAGGPTADADGAVLGRPLSLAVNYAGASTLHLDMNHLLVYRWDAGAGQWQPQPTVVDTSGQVARAVSNRLGNFDLEAPLLCPNDSVEPDDRFFTATYVEPGSAPYQRLFDVRDDQDWFRLDAVHGHTYLLQLSPVGAGVAARLEVYYVDGLTRLAGQTSQAPGAGVSLAWQPPQDGAYFIRATPATRSTVGCNARYKFWVSLQR